MRKLLIMAILLTIVIGCLLLWVVVTDAPIADALFKRGTAPTVSPSYWHRIDELNPKEDTIHYEEERYAP